MSPLEFVPELKKKLEEAQDLRNMTPEQQKNYLLNVFGKRKFIQK